MSTINIMSPTSFEQQCRQAYEQVAKQLYTLPTKQLTHVNTDVPTVVAITLCSLSQLRAIAPELSASINGFEETRLDELETYTYALMHAHRCYEQAAAIDDDKEAVVQRAMRLRDLLHAHAFLFVMHGVIDASQLRNVKGTGGHKQLAIDVSLLATVIRSAWEDLHNKTLLIEGTLHEAARLAERLLILVAQGDRGSAHLQAAKLTRKQAYTLFFQVYQSTRAAVLFARFEQRDADKILPSLFAGRKGTARKRARAVCPTSRPVALARPE